jgi:hypothetical protein
MTKQELVKVFSMFNVCYPKFLVDGKEEIMLDVWYQMLKEYPYEMIMLAAQNHVKTSKFQPTIHDIIEQVSQFENVGRIDAMTAWGHVTKAIRNYGYYRQIEALKSMPEDVAKIVENMGWQNLCMSENEMADRAHFTKAYDTMQKREKQIAMISGNNIKMIQQEEIN